MSTALVTVSPTDMTIEQFKQMLPDKVKKSVNQELIDQVTDLLKDPDMFESYRDNLLGYTNVMSDGRFKVDNYVSAVKYVSHKLMGSSNLDAYTKTFPDKMADFQRRNIASKDIASYVTAYNKSKLVNLIFGQTLVPSYVLNADLYQKALNVQAELMVSATSEKVRTDAANSLLTHLKVPEATKVQLDVNVKSDKAIESLHDTMRMLAQQQQQMMRDGLFDAKHVAESKLIIEQDVTDA